AFTLQVGRRAFAHRRAVVCRSVAEAISALESLSPARVQTGTQEPHRRPLAFMFPGQGAQYVGMGRGLYVAGGRFRQEVDRWAREASPELGLDLLEVLYPEAGAETEAGERLRETRVAQVALF